MINIMDAFSDIDWNQRLDDKIDTSIKEMLQLAEKTAYITEDLDKKVNAEETLREYIRDTESTFSLEKKDVDSMTSVELNAYVDYLDSLW